MKNNWLKFEDIDKGTKIRTLIAVLVAVNEAIVAFGDVDFGNKYVNLAYKIISTIFAIAVLAVNSYWNNDFTIEAQVGTVATRTLKEDPAAVVTIETDADVEDLDMDETDEEGDESIEEGE